MIKLAILDVDGILTDGKKTYDINGNVISKTFCDKDFTAIKRLKASGVKVCFLSGDNKINEMIAKNRNIDFYYARGKEKAEFIDIFIKTYNITPDNMLYIGDDLFDLNIMTKVAYAFCPKDSPNKVKNQCGFQNVIDRNGGNNVLSRMVDILLERELINDTSMQEIEALDKKEIF